MKYKYLLQQSTEHFDANPVLIEGAIGMNVFSKGVQWMCERMNELALYKVIFNKEVPFAWYGFLKYGICITATLLSAIIASWISIFLLPLCILVFYFFEVQFLFLFPLLIDGIHKPIRTSVEKTYKAGIWKCMCIVMPVGLFMIAGLFNIKSPLRNWHIGSLAIIILYQHEIRDRR